jgi:predicted small lipoprotein YifL
MKQVLVAIGFLTLAACGDSGPVETVPPATGVDLQQYSQNITDRTDRRKDASLWEYFCKTTLDAPCPADIQEKLAGFMAPDGSRVDLADAFIRLKSTTDLNDAQAVIPDELYVDSAYRVILGREPDPSGRANFIKFLGETGDRGNMARAILVSPEFRAR